LSEQQFQTALDRFQLGRFLSAEPVWFGNMGQHVFLTSTQGNFVLRGAPLDAAQFPCERWFMQQLHEHTRVPVPWPYLLDRRRDIFGWNYILMPRLPGLSLADQQAKQGLSPQARQSIACALGETLAELHSLTWPCVGDYDLATDTIKPLEQDYADHILAHLRLTLRMAPADIAWIEEVIAQGRDALHAPFQPCCVHGDYQESNVLVEESDGQWRVSGVFDMYPGFKDPESDLSRPLATYLDEHTPALAQEFLRAYSKRRPLRAGWQERFPLYMLQERLAMWEWAQREKRIWWDERLTLREWVEPFTSAYHFL
jgi:aminoglycoside phosphotransferase (APT) family kinase protein